jgi:hypothetical protein
MLCSLRGCLPRHESQSINQCYMCSKSAVDGCIDVYGRVWLISGMIESLNGESIA